MDEHEGTEFKWVGDLEKGYPIASKVFQMNCEDKVREWQKSLGIETIDRPSAAEGMRVVGIITSKACIKLAKEKLGLTISSHYPTG